MDIWRRAARKEKNYKSKNQRNYECPTHFYGNRRQRNEMVWAFEGDEKQQNSKNDFGVEFRGQEKKGEAQIIVNGPRRSMITDYAEDSVL